MATLTVQPLTAAGSTPTFGAAAGGGDKVQPGDHTFIVVKNGGGSPITVTIDDPTTQAPAGAAAFNPDASISVGNGSEKWIGPLPASRFAGTDGLAAITYSGVTSVTVAAIRT
jgi:hypothetical protein